MGRPVVHFEIFGTDGEALRNFYRDTFGWKLMTIPDGSYSMVDTDSGDDHMHGGIGSEPETEQRVLVYIQVPDINAYLARIAESGGAVVRERTDYGAVITALARDPQGNVFGLSEEPAPPEPH